MNEWGIPDWRDPSAYGDTESWKFSRWRWEFYRRRDDLRAYFDAHAQKTYEDYLDVNPDQPLPDSPNAMASVDIETREKFGYSPLPNPRFGDQSIYAIWPYVNGLRTQGPRGEKGSIASALRLAGVALSSHQEKMLRHLLDCDPIQLGENEKAIIFDLTKPIAPQIRRAQRILLGNQEINLGAKIQKRRHPLKWLGYLRTLDARADGASWAEIAAIHPITAQTEQSARDIWDQANALCFNF